VLWEAFLVKVGGLKCGLKGGGLGEMQLVWVGKSRVAMDGDFRSSTAGDALLMESALAVVIQQARDGPSAGVAAGLGG
jgi:hypothetical protein